MRDAVPVEDLLLFLGADAVVLVQEIKEGALGLLERRIGSGLEVSEVGEDPLFELLGIPHGAPEGLESKGQASHNVGSRDMKKVAPVANQSKTPPGLHLSRKRTNHRMQET